MSLTSWLLQCVMSISRILPCELSGCVLQMQKGMKHCSTELISIRPNAGKEVQQCEDVNQWCCQPNITNFSREKVEFLHNPDSASLGD